MKASLLAVLAFAFVSIALCGETESLAPLGRKDWLITKTEMERLNACSIKTMQLALFSMLKAAEDVDLEGQTLVGFKFADLNGDGMAEAICLLDVSGRGIVQDIFIMSRKNGVFIKSSVRSFSMVSKPEALAGIETFSKGRQSLLVANETVLCMHTASPIWTFPVLYAWDGSKCADVSKENWDYYKDVFMKSVKSRYMEYLKALKSGSANQKEDALIGATGMAMALKRQAELFPTKAKLEPEDKAKLRKLISMLYEGCKSEESLDKKISEIDSYLKNAK